MNKLFQERLNELLSKKLYTYEELSQKLGLKSKGTIAKYASGQIKNPSISTIEKIAELYNVSPSWLSGLSDNKYANMNSNDYIALTQKDDSLSPEILKGDKLLIRCQSKYEPENICVVDYKNEILIRKIIKTDIGLILKPLNTDYEPIVCLEKDIKNLKVLGIVVKSERFLK